jgi:UDPglucose--hexose-1-phosphate uridylyltransferase
MIDQRPHRRLNPLTGDWVLVSPHRNLRPWLGSTLRVEAAAGLDHDSDCYLCAGNLRASGQRNPHYKGPFVFDNDYPALLVATAEASDPGSALFVRAAASGVCRVLCFSPDHSKTLPELSQTEVEALVAVWCAQSRELEAQHAWVQVFENKGAAMGCSNPHPHGQIWATDFLPTEAQLEDQHQRAYHARTGRPLLLDYAQAEAAQFEQRGVVRTEHWIAVVPHWAAWPFETLLMPLAPVHRLSALGAAQQSDLALALRLLTARYDNLFRCPFPYSMGWHGAPGLAGDMSGRGDGPVHEPHWPHWHLHAHFYPPLLRSATVRKFMVGFEMLAEAQRDITPEQAAALLRDVPARHYRAKPGA